MLRGLVGGVFGCVLVRVGWGGELVRYGWDGWGMRKVREGGRGDVGRWG